MTGSQSRKDRKHGRRGKLARQIPPHGHRSSAHVVRQNTQGGSDSRSAEEAVERDAIHASSAARASETIQIGSETLSVGGFDPPAATVREPRNGYELAIVWMLEDINVRLRFFEIDPRAYVYIDKGGAAQVYLVDQQPPPEEYEPPGQHMFDPDGPVTPCYREAMFLGIKARILATSQYLREQNALILNVYFLPGEELALKDTQELGSWITRLCVPDPATLREPGNWVEWHVSSVLTASGCLVKFYDLDLHAFVYADDHETVRVSQDVDLRPTCQIADPQDELRLMYHRLYQEKRIGEYEVTPKVDARRTSQLFSPEGDLTLVYDHENRLRGARGRILVATMKLSSGQLSVNIYCLDGCQLTLNDVKPITDWVEEANQ
jgi:hypothetical protein